MYVTIQPFCFLLFIGKERTSVKLGLRSEELKSEPIKKENKFFGVNTDRATTRKARWPLRLGSLLKILHHYQFTVSTLLCLTFSRFFRCVCLSRCCFFLSFSMFPFLGFSPNKSSDRRVPVLDVRSEKSCAHFGIATPSGSCHAPAPPLPLPAPF